MTPLLEVTDLVKHFPIKRGIPTRSSSSTARSRASSAGSSSCAWICSTI